MKPVGLPDPRTGREPYAVVQLRREDRAGQMWNLVGFQTRLRIPEQQRVFRDDPRDWRDAEFLRYGSIHRNCVPQQSRRARSGAHRCGRRPALLCRTAHRGRGLHRIARHRAPGRDQPGAAARRAADRRCPRRPRCWAGSIAILREADPKHFQPMNANFGLLDPLPGKVRKDRKREMLVERAQADFSRLLESSGDQLRSVDFQHEDTKGTQMHEAALATANQFWVAGFVFLRVLRAFVFRPAIVVDRPAMPASPKSPSSSHTSRRSARHSPHTVKAYGRDLEAFAEFCDRHYGGRLGVGDRRPAGGPRLPG